MVINIGRKYPNILFIVLDCLRADHVSAYGYHRQTTPNIDKLAHKNVLVKRAITQSTFTVTSAASFFTGLYPEVHGATGSFKKLSPDVMTMAERLSSLGYETILFDGIKHFSGPWGIGRGFDYITSPIRGESKHFTAKEFYIYFLRYINSISKERPFFAVLWLTDLHNPNTVPEQARIFFSKGLDGENIRKDSYDGALRYADHYIGKILEELDEKGLLDDMLIVVMGDHGDIFDEHYWFEGLPLFDILRRFPYFHPMLTSNGYMDHAGVLPYDGVICVPLIIKFPKEEYSEQIKGQVELIDLYPTLLDYMGFKIKELPFQGRSMMEDLHGHPNRKKTVFGYTCMDDRSPVFTFASNDEYKLMKVIMPKFDIKYFLSLPYRFKGRMIGQRIGGKEKLFKIGSAEKHNLSRKNGDQFEVLSKDLSDWRSANKVFKEKIRLSKVISGINRH